MATFPLYDPITIYSKPTANDRHIGRAFHKRDAARLRAQINAAMQDNLLGLTFVLGESPLGGINADASVKQVQAVVQPSSSVTQGAAGANGGLIPMRTYVLSSGGVTLEMVNAVVNMLLRDNVRFLNEYDYASRVGDEPSRGDRVINNGVGTVTDDEFNLDISELG
jgi:hypothetical protein